MKSPLPNNTNKLSLPLATALAVAGMATSTFGAAITVSTVGTYAPNPNNLTIRDAASNSTSGGITLSAFRTQITNAFANNTGGVYNAEESSGTLFGVGYGENAANAITAKLGVSQTNSLNFYRLDGSVGGAAFSSTANGTQTVSGSGAIGFSFDSAPSIAFTEGLSHLGLTLVPRPTASETRTATLVAFLDNHTTENPSTISSTNEGNAGLGDAVFYGFAAPAGRTIVRLDINPSGFTRFDDLGFIAPNAVPEPSVAVLGGLGLLTLLRRRRAAAL